MSSLIGNVFSSCTGNTLNSIQLDGNRFNFQVSDWILNAAQTRFEISVAHNLSTSDISAIEWFEQDADGVITEVDVAVTVVDDNTIQGSINNLGSGAFDGFVNIVIPEPETPQAKFSQAFNISTDWTDTGIAGLNRYFIDFNHSLESTSINIQVQDTTGNEIFVCPSIQSENRVRLTDPERFSGVIFIESF